MRLRWPNIFPWIGSSLLAFFILEIVLRSFGFLPPSPVSTVVSSTPPHSLCPHPQLGFTLCPGSYRVSINNGPAYMATHGNDSTRVTGFSDFSIPLIRKKLFFYGCSFTYGMGVDDQQTFPFLIQKKLQDWQVYNYGVPAYGTLQALLQLQSQIERGPIPQMAILNYSALHDSRNKLSIAQQKYWQEALGAVAQDQQERFRSAAFSFCGQSDGRPFDYQLDGD